MAYDPSIVHHSLKRSATVPFLLVPLALALSGGCGGDDVSVNAPPAVGCDASERAEGTECVPTVFDQAVIPPPTNASDIAREGETAYVKSTLLVFFPGQTSIADATAAVAPEGGEVVGAIPFAGMFRVRFATAPTMADLVAKSAVLGSKAGVVAVMPDKVLPLSTLSAVTKPDNDFDLVKEGAPYDDFYDGSAHNPRRVRGAGAHVRGPPAEGLPRSPPARGGHRRHAEPEAWHRRRLGHRRAE